MRVFFIKGSQTLVKLSGYSQMSAHLVVDLILEGYVVRDFIFLLNLCYAIPQIMGHYNNRLISESDNLINDSMTCLIQSVIVTALCC